MSTAAKFTSSTASRSGASRSPARTPAAPAVSVPCGRASDEGNHRWRPRRQRAGSRTRSCAACRAARTPDAAAAGVRPVSDRTGPGSPDSATGPGIVARWEWRTFGEGFGTADDRLRDVAPQRIHQSDELYLLSLEGSDTVKMRDGLLDIKHLEQVSQRRARALDAGDEGRVSAYGRRYGCPADGAGRRDRLAAACRLHAGRAARGAGRAGSGPDGGQRAQAAQALHAGRLHGRADRCHHRQRRRRARWPSSRRMRSACWRRCAASAWMGAPTSATRGR